MSLYIIKKTAYPAHKISYNAYDDTARPQSSYNLHPQ